MRSFSKLKGRENYDLWKISAKSYMVIKGLWSCVLKEPTTSKMEEMEKDLKALSELKLLLDENLYSYIAGAETTKQAWMNLEKSFEDSGLCRKVELLKQLVKLTLADCDSVEDYVSRMVTTCIKVGKAGLKIDDVDVIDVGRVAGGIQIGSYGDRKLDNKIDIGCGQNASSTRNQAEQQ